MLRNLARKLLQTNEIKNLTNAGAKATFEIQEVVLLSTEKTVSGYFVLALPLFSGKQEILQGL